MPKAVEGYVLSDSDFGNPLHQGDDGSWSGSSL